MAGTPNTELPPNTLEDFVIPNAPEVEVAPKTDLSVGKVKPLAPAVVAAVGALNLDGVDGITKVVEVVRGLPNMDCVGGLAKEDVAGVVSNVGGVDGVTKDDVVEETFPNIDCVDGVTKDDVVAGTLPNIDCVGRVEKAVVMETLPNKVCVGGIAKTDFPGAPPQNIDAFVVKIEEPDVLVAKIDELEVETPPFSSLGVIEADTFDDETPKAITFDVGFTKVGAFELVAPKMDVFDVGVLKACVPAPKIGGREEGALETGATGAEVSKACVLEMVLPKIGALDTGSPKNDVPMMGVPDADVLEVTVSNTEVTFGVAPLKIDALVVVGSEVVVIVTDPIFGVGV